MRMLLSTTHVFVRSAKVLTPANTHTLEQVAISMNITGCEAPSYEASQVNRYGSTVLWQELEARRNAPKSIGDQLRSDAAAQEVMPGGTSGEVRLAAARKWCWRLRARKLNFKIKWLRDSTWMVNFQMIYYPQFILRRIDDGHWESSNLEERAVNHIS